jgi:DNA processing protein
MAVWLGLLAAHRGGLSKRFVDEKRSLENVLRATPDEIRAMVGPPRRGRMGPDEQEESTFRRLLAAGPSCAATELGPPGEIRVITWDDPAYPADLKQVRDAPPVLFARGRVADGLRALAARPVVAVVGTRAPSPYGREMTRLIARDLTDAGLLVVSGMALGVDAVAQREAVARQAAAAAPGRAGHTRRVSTVAVLGCGIRVAYPRENARLAEDIARTGLVVSEFPGDVPARPWRFPCRNRVIAGLARAVVVVEGSDRSGSLLTAGFALQLGRDVLAVPGEAGRRLSAGPHKLLRQGAHVCESAADVLEVIGLRDAAWSTRRVAGAQMSGPLGVVVSALDDGERTVDELAVAVGGSAAEVAALLAGLEVDGLVARTDGGRYRLCRG